MGPSEKLWPLPLSQVPCQLPMSLAAPLLHRNDALGGLDVILHH